ncbi:hypothetical protein GCM10027589_05950 [Actinocorallia lasiicapitis]
MYAAVGDDPRIVVVRDLSRCTECMYQMMAVPWKLVYDKATRCFFFERLPAGRFEPAGTRTLPVWPPGTQPVLRDGRHGIDTGTEVLWEGVRTTTNISDDSPDLLTEFRHDPAISPCTEKIHTTVHIRS